MPAGFREEREGKEMIKRSWRRLLSGVALMSGLVVCNTAFAQDGCTPSGPSCQDCEQIFADAGQKLTDQLASLSCCAPEACCEDVCGDIDLSCGDGCAEGCISDDDGCGIEIGGWIQMGYHSSSTGLFNSHPHRFNLHQGWLYAERVADGSNGMDWGFRTDIMYGVDAADTQAFGNSPGRWDFQNGMDYGGGYGWAIPQAYAELAVGDLSVIAGHFYTLVGYEVVTAPDNFFYSHAFTMFNSEPFTHTGVLATYGVSDDVDVYGGWTAGWDTGFDQLNNGSSFLGGFSTSISEDATFTYMATAGELGWRGNGYSHSLVLDLALTDDLNYVIQSDLVRTNDHDADPTTAGKDDDIGINQYLIYSVSEQVGAGTRVEWWKNDGNSQYAATFGLNITPADNLIIRPEYRYQWNPGSGVEQGIFGVDAIVTF